MPPPRRGVTGRSARLRWGEGRADHRLFAIPLGGYVDESGGLGAEEEALGVDDAEVTLAPPGEAVGEPGAGNAVAITCS